MPKQNEKKVPRVDRDNWNAEKLAEESANEESDDIVRKVLRGNAARGNPNDRDVAGAPDSEDTPQGREENKKQTGAEKNG
ncbi:MAG: hypothetical protein ACR2LT_02815 [Pyrinomonadaceae bacterium]